MSDLAGADTARHYAKQAEAGAADVPGLDPAVSPRDVTRAAVIGAGTMGSGIAMCFVNAGLPVTLIETDAAALQRGLERIAAAYAGSVKRGRMTAEAAAAAQALIDGKLGLDAVTGSDLVIEAVFEELGVKQQVFRTVAQHVAPGTILATNTSYLDVDAIAAAVDRPQDVVGMHFFSPANVMRLLEVVRADRTAPDVVATAVALGHRLGKLPVVVGVCYGFVGNRLLAVRTRQAERLLMQGALPQDVDAALTGFGFRMGQFAMIDLAGLDIDWRIRKATGASAPVSDALCEMGRLGQKSGRGYYDYSQGVRTPLPDPAVEALILRVSAEHGITRRSFTEAELLEQLLLPMANEGARILEEGIAARAGDIDAIWLAGYGWPAERGGPMYYADTLGLPLVVARLQAMCDLTGDATLAPAPLLQRLAESGGRLTME